MALTTSFPSTAFRVGFVYCLFDVMNRFCNNLRMDLMLTLKAGGAQKATKTNNKIHDPFFDEMASDRSSRAEHWTY